MSKNSDFLSTLKSLSNNVHLGNKTATDVADSVNEMGFVKRGEFEALKQEVAALKKGTPKKSAKKTTVKKAVKKTAKKAAKKKVAK